MNTKTLMVALIAVLAVFSFSFALADNANSVVSGDVTVEVDGVVINDVNYNPVITLAAFAGETVPVKVYFTSADSAKDVKVQVEISSGSKDYSSSYFIGDVVNDSRLYRTGVMNVQIPSTFSDTTEDLYLRVIITANGLESYLQEYLISAQRNSYQIDILSVDFDNSVSAGDTVPVSVVVKNRGFQDSQDGFVTVSITELGISAKGYFGDLANSDICTDNCDKDDSAQKVLYLKIPMTAKDGVYDVTVKAYDDETSTTVKALIKVSASTATQILTADKSQDFSAGETRTYDLILVNSANTVAVYSLSAVSGSDLSVSVPSVVTVDAGSSKTVQVTVKASSDADKGSYPFTVSVNGQSLVYTANVTGTSVSVSAVAITVILVVVFVILLVLLIVLLTRKDNKETTEVETSYY